MYDETGEINRPASKEFSQKFRQSSANDQQGKTLWFFRWAGGPRIAVLFYYQKHLHLKCFNYSMSTNTIESTHILYAARAPFPLSVCYSQSLVKNMSGDFVITVRFRCNTVRENPDCADFYVMSIANRFLWTQLREKFNKNMKQNLFFLLISCNFPNANAHQVLLVLYLWWNPWSKCWDRKKKHRKSYSIPFFRKKTNLMEILLKNNIRHSNYRFRMLAVVQVQHFAYFMNWNRVSVHNQKNYKCTPVQVEKTVTV